MFEAQDAGAGDMAANLESASPNLRATKDLENEIVN